MRRVRGMHIHAMTINSKMNSMVFVIEDDAKHRPLLSVFSSFIQRLTILRIDRIPISNGDAYDGAVRHE